MFMLKYFILIVCIIICSVSCKKNSNLNRKAESTHKINDSIYVLYPEYKVADCRRYGVFPDSASINAIHPKTNVSRIQSLLDFAEKFNVEVYFEKGYYKSNLIIDSRKNLNLRFNNSEFNLLHIKSEKGDTSSNIKIKGKLILYDRLGTYNSHNIEIDSVIIKTDVKKNLRHAKSRGCHIYKKTDTLSIKYLEIQDLASEGEIYKNNHAALAIDGLRENPTHISINEVVIKSSDRHGAYITGSNNRFNSIIINKYAQGTSKGMSGMQDSDKGEEVKFTGLWINRCHDCQFDYVKIISKYSDIRKYSPLKLDEGNIAKPTFINNLVLDLAYTDTLVVDDVLTNVLVKKVEVTSD